MIQHSAALPLTEMLPLMFVSALERRYLSNLHLQHWRIEGREGDHARPLLREVIGLGRPYEPGEWALAMPHVLTACHEPGHALVMAVHGQGERHRLYLGGRRIIGGGAHSTEDYLLRQESSFKAYFSGLRMAAVRRLDSEELPEMATFLQTAPALGIVTGIPSGRGGPLPLAMQSLDGLVKAVGNQQYMLLVVAEPLEPWIVDATLDACRRLKSEVHAQPRRVIRQVQDRHKDEENIDRKVTEEGDGLVSPELRGLLLFSQLVGLPIAGAASNTLPMLLDQHSETRTSHEETQRVSTSTSWNEQATIELADANVEACEQLLSQHVQRLQSGRSAGWWRVAVYIAGEGEAAVHRVAGALRSVCSGDVSALDPIRTIRLPAYLLRGAIERGQVLSLRPAFGGQGHPLGESFDTLGTCLSAEELSVLINLPQREIPGLPMRDQGNFALSVPPPTDDSIALGTLQDGLDRDLGPVTITAAALNRHVFVTGITGYGKTNTCMQILLEAYNKLGVPFLVLEPAKTEYRRLGQVEELRGRLRVYAIGDQSSLPFRLNPLSLVPGVPLGRHIDLLKAVFNASFPMFAGMPYVLEEAILEVYAERGWSLVTSQNGFLGTRATLDERSSLIPCLQDLHDKIEVVLARKKYGQEIHLNMGAALRARLRSLMVGNKGLTLNARRSTPLEDLFDSPTVIELQNLGDDEEKAFVMALLFVLLYEYAEVRQRGFPAGSRGKLQHLMLIEEAHRLLQATRGPVSAEVGDPRAKAVAMFTDMLAEMRAYGEGFIIADQIPTKLTPETLKNSNLKILHRLVAPDDRQAAGSCINLTDGQMRHLNNLAPGLAIVHDDRIGEAVLTRIYPVKDTRAPDLAEEELRAISNAVSGPDRIYLYRHAGCRSCPSPCDFYYRLAEAHNQGDLVRALLPFLESLLVDDAAQAWEQWSNWRTEWQSNANALHGTQGATAVGVTYCAVTQAAYDWLGTLLAARSRVDGRAGHLSPADRLQRETAVRALGELFLAWTQKAALDEEGRVRFNQVRKRLLCSVAKAPPHELAGCHQCPARCQMLPFVAPLDLAKLAGQLVAILTRKVPVQERILSLLQSLGAIEQTISLLARRKHNERLRRSWLYCLLTNLEPTPATSAARDELLDALRQSPIDVDTGELLDIFGGTG